MQERECHMCKKTSNLMSIGFCCKCKLDCNNEKNKLLNELYFGYAIMILSGVYIFGLLFIVK